MAAAAVVVSAGCMPAPGTSVQVSVSSTGAATTGTGRASGTGRVVVFDTPAPDVAPGDPARAFQWDDGDVFVHDVPAGTTEAISVTPTGTTGDHKSFGGELSDDGRFVLFTSAATNLTGDPSFDGEVLDVFLRDRSTGTTTLLTPDSPTSDGDNMALDLSDDGRHALLEVWDATVADGTVGTVVLDRVSGIFQAVPLPPDIEGPSWIGDAALAGDGETVAFNAMRRDPDDGTLSLHQYLWDVGDDHIQHISPPALATPWMGSPSQSAPHISDDGDVVVWGRSRDEITCCDTRVDEQVFAWHRSTGQVTEVTPPTRVDGGTLALSGDGAWIAATSGDDRADVVLWRLDGTALHRTTGTATPSDSRPRSVSDDGRYVSYTEANTTYLWARPD